jgi:hypothetical protein
MSRLRDHHWVNAGFIHIKMVCKHCDVEKEKTESLYCKYIEPEPEDSNEDSVSNMWNQIYW